MAAEINLMRAVDHRAHALDTHVRLCTGYSGSFDDGFDDARNGWTLVHNNQADILTESGQLHITVKQPDSLAWSIAMGKVFDDFHARRGRHAAGRAG